MIRLSKSVLAVGAVVLAGSLITLMNPKAVHALAAALVQVTNTASNPAVTQSVGAQAGNMVHLTCEVMFSAGQPFYIPLRPGDRRGNYPHLGRGRLVFRFRIGKHVWVFDGSLSVSDRAAISLPAKRRLRQLEKSPIYQSSITTAYGNERYVQTGGKCDEKQSSIWSSLCSVGYVRRRCV